MVKEVTEIRKNYRNMSPTNCRITFSIEEDNQEKRDMIVLLEQENENNLDYPEPLPRIKSAKNTPYNDTER